MAPACGGGQRGLVAFVVVCFLSAACRAQQPTPERLKVETYSYDSFPESLSDKKELLLLNDARIHHDALQVTKDTANEAIARTLLPNNSGSVLLNRAFTLWRRRDGDQNNTVRVVSFNTTFSMNVFSFSPTGAAGEGLTFLVAPSRGGPPPGSSGGYLGLTNATLEAGPATNRRFVAIEFDTVKQEYDPNDNHVGLDVGSVVSSKTANLADFNITSIATPNRNYTVWVEYDGVARHVSVFMGAMGEPKPAVSVLDAPLDLSRHVPETAYLGFSASTGATYQLNCILDWKLTIEVFPVTKNKTWIVLVATIVPITVIAVAIVTFFLTRMLRARRSMEQRQEQLENKLNHLPGMPRGFAYDKLRKATNNFDERLRLGKGGYGEVYKGLLPADDDARPEGMMEVAVKRFIRDDANGVNDFIAEVDIINRLRHKNIVPLIGWCYKKGQLLLVYEFMPNGSMDQHLFRRDVHDELQPPVLSWDTRYGIVGDVAAGLHYVHHEYGRMVLHRDIKASNVLLDASFRARLGDFGLARVVEHDRNSFTDLAVAGTRGYIAPEYSMGHKATRRTDVFAFGALVLEVVTGQRALLGEPRCPLLCDWVWRLHGRGALLGAVDQNLGTAEFDAGEASRLLLLGLACSSPNPGDRPTMPQVLQVLSKAASPPEVPPFKPTFMWPPEGGEHFELIDFEMTTTTGTASGTSAMATHDTSLRSFQPPTAAHSTEDEFPAVSYGR